MRRHGWVDRFDRRNPGQSRFVADWLRRLAHEHEILISTQVFIELRSVLTRKWVPAFTPEDTRLAREALRSHCRVLDSEDCGHGQRLGGRLLVQDPLISF